MDVAAAMAATQLGPVWVKCSVCGKKHYTHMAAWRQCAHEVVDRAMIKIAGSQAVTDFVRVYNDSRQVNYAYDVFSAINAYFAVSKPRFLGKYNHSAWSLPFKRRLSACQRANGVDLPLQMFLTSSETIGFIKPWVIAADRESVNRNLEVMVMNSLATSKFIGKARNDCAAMLDAAEDTVRQTDCVVGTGHATISELMEIELARQAIAWSSDVLAAIERLRQAAVDMAQRDSLRS